MKQGRDEITEWNMFHKFSFNHYLIQSNPLSVSLQRLIFSTENMDLNVLTHKQLLRGNVILYISNSLEAACL